jgi:hypothetical protein
MHLLSEKKLIFWALILTAILFVPLLLFPTFVALDAVRVN